MLDPAPISLDIPGITVRRATIDDLDRVRAVVQDATRRVLEKGITEWRLYLTQKGEARILARVRGDNGAETYLARRTSDGGDVGVYTLQWHDAKHWGDRLGNDGQAGYLNMLNVHRTAAGTGLGQQLLRHAESLIASAGRSFLRLYCAEQSDFLIDYYARMGFHRAAYQPSDDDIVLWQKRVGGV
jgi:ribosomal protein S18 acetylase RimI-like enzyme